MAVKTHDRFFVEVAAGSFEEQHYTPLANEVLRVSMAYGQAGSSPDTVVSLFWDKGGADEQLLFCTHSASVDQEIAFEVTGDGTKKLTICLQNNQLTSDLLGLGWRD
jgi:hypothetical protein